MKRIAKAVVAGRDLIRKKSFIHRTLLTLAISLAAVFGAAIVLDWAYQFIASNSGVLCAAGLVGSQFFLYKKDFSNFKVSLSKAMSDPAPDRPRQGSSAERHSAAAPAASFAVPENIGDEFSDDDDLEEEEEEMLAREQFEDD